MNPTTHETIRAIPSGIPGLDDILGGGIPEFSFNYIAGGPGCGKTTMVHQIMFANATPERPALHFTVLGEPPIKMLRYQQRFSFFDVGQVPSALRFVHVDDSVLKRGLEAVLAFVVAQVEEAQPAIVVVDSFHSVTRSPMAREAGYSLEHFVQRLALFLTSWEATTFLIGEYQEDRTMNPVLTVADGIIRLSQSVERNSVVRKLQVVKMRGQAQVPGLHTFRITSAGLQVFPRILRTEPIHDTAADSVCLSTGVPRLDDMLQGGIPAGQSVLLAGPSGSGKTVLSMQFISEGIRQGEPGIVVVFERRPADFLKSIHAMSQFEKMMADGMLQLVYLRPLDLSVDETLYEVSEAVRRLGARRVVIDSLSGFELALAPTFREEFREALYRMVGTLTTLGVTVMMSVEVADSYTDLRFSPHGVSFLTDIIIVQRYCILNSSVRRVLMIAKHRSSSHSHQLMEYEIKPDGLAILGPLPEVDGALSAVPRTISGPQIQDAPGA